MKKYKVLKELDGGKYKPNDTIELDDATAKVLINKKAIELIKNQGEQNG